MIFTPRLPVNENSLHKHEEASGTASAGAIMYLTESGTVAKVSTSGQVPYGILFHNVKAPLPGLPQNFEFPGEIGSADARLGDPVLLYQEGGTFETDYYEYTGATGLAAGDMLYARANGSASDGALTDDTANVATESDGSTIKAVAQVLEPLTDDEATAGKALLVRLLI